jgi:hypothetical protein
MGFHESKNTEHNSYMLNLWMIYIQSSMTSKPHMDHYYEKNSHEIALQALWKHGNSVMPVDKNEKISRRTRDFLFFMEPMTGIEPVTYPLPWDCSTTEPHRRFFMLYKYCTSSDSIVFSRKIQAGVRMIFSPS